MPILRNPRHELFSQGLAFGMTADAAYAAAGYKRDRGHAARLAANGSISDRVVELQEASEEKFEMDRVAWLGRLKGNADKCRKAGEAAGERQALRELGLGMGWYEAERKELAVNTTDKSVKTIDEMILLETVQRELARALKRNPPVLEALQALMAA